MAAPNAAKADDSVAPDGAASPAASPAQPVAQPLNVDLRGLQRRAVNTPGATRTMDIEQLLINIGLLMMQSPSHRYFFLADLEWLVYPAVQHKQFKLYMKEGRPVAYVSWARLSEQAEARFVVARRLTPMDWTSGDRLWMIDIVTPYGATENVLSDLRDRIFIDQVFKYWRGDGSNQRIETVHPLAAGPAADRG